MPDLDMGAYGAYVWPCWAISAVVLTALTVRALMASRRWKSALRRLEDDRL